MVKQRGKRGPRLPTILQTYTVNLINSEATWAEAGATQSTSIYKITHHHLQSTTQPSSKYLCTTLFKVPHYPFQSTTPPSSKYHTILFKVPHNPLQSITLPFSKYQYFHLGQYPEVDLYSTPRKDELNVTR